jgi:anaerobic ribonucleoside-triphosphate reductase activating protein
VKLALSRVHFPVTTLGPGRRLGIWLQGCSIRCPGCVSADTWAAKLPDVTVSELLQRVRPWLTQCDGVTVSGGEPFEQPKALEALLRAIRSTSAANILVYSGFALEQLIESSTVRAGLVDCLISDPFEVDAPQSMPLRGSDNQRMTCLTSLGQQVFGSLNQSATDAEKRLDVMFDDDGVVWMAGIPRRGDMRRLEQVLADQGHVIRTTESRRG